jgi:hypothetical protein
MNSNLSQLVLRSFRGYPRGLDRRQHSIKGRPWKGLKSGTLKPFGLSSETHESKNPCPIVRISSAPHRISSFILSFPFRPNQSPPVYISFTLTSSDQPPSLYAPLSLSIEIHLVLMEMMAMEISESSYAYLALSCGKQGLPATKHRVQRVPTPAIPSIPQVIRN